MEPSARWDDIGKLVLRWTVAALMLFHGVYKIEHGIAWMAEPLRQFGLPFFIGYSVYVAEVVAPVLLILGLFTRLSALAIAFDMVMAVVLVLRDQAFTRKEMGGGWAIELEAFFFFASLAIVFLGAGRYAIGRRTDSGRRTSDAGRR